MFSFLPQTRFLLALTILISAAAPAAVNAGWMGFRNDTQSTLMIQETLAPGTVGRAGKPQKIYTNETVRDTAATASGKRTFTIFDPTHPDKALYSATVPCPPANENVLFVLKRDGKGGLLVEAVRTPTGVSKAAKKR